MNWPAIEAAIAAWIERSAGVTAQWANQRLPEPIRPYAKLNRISIIGHGMDEQRSDTDLSRVGEEVELLAVARREFSVSCQIFAAPAVGAAAAADLMERAKIALSLESTNDAFDAAGIAVVDAGNISDLPESPTNSWSSRAQMDVSFYATSTASERTTFIEKLELVDERTGTAWVVPGDGAA
jgi:hypothetical protein